LPEGGPDRGAGRNQVRILMGRPAVGPYLVALALAFVSGAASIAAGAEPIALAGRAMGTTWSVKFVQPAQPLDPALLERRVAARFEELEQQFSTFRPGSEISRFNATATREGEWFPVSREVTEVARLARELSAATDGAFDVTVDPLVRLWGFGPTRTAGVPEPGEIAAARASVGWRALEERASPPALRRTKPGMTVDFSSIAKGFAADEVSAQLVALGVANHLAQVGGDVKTRGAGPDGTGWPVGIESPQEDTRTIAAVIGLVSRALSTSGDYRNYFIEGDRRYGHIIDPRTGEPVAGDLAAVSVVAENCARSSGWATALFVLGAGEGLALAKREGLACVFFVRDGRGGFARRATVEFEQFLR
jgi:FAD:protein FMN transferase